jgi:hypothetical protein
MDPPINIVMSILRFHTMLHHLWYLVSRTVFAEGHRLDA